MFEIDLPYNVCFEICYVPKSSAIMDDCNIEC